MSKYIFYTDGSTSGNGTDKAEGGFGVVGYDEENNLIGIYSSGTIEQTTNNRMEMEALLWAIDLVKDNLFPCDSADIYSDSAYVVNMFNTWIRSWARNGWRKADNREPENLDLVKKLYEYADESFPNYRVLKCRGHAGIEGNELADKAARRRGESDDNLTNFKIFNIINKERSEIKF